MLFVNWHFQRFLLQPVPSGRIFWRNWESEPALGWLKRRVDPGGQLDLHIWKDRLFQDLTPANPKPRELVGVRYPSNLPWGHGIHLLWKDPEENLTPEVCPTGSSEKGP